jgi:tetratricopeptide (TPR) repeat protein
MTALLWMTLTLAADGTVGSEGALAGAQVAVQKQDWSGAAQYYAQAAQSLPRCAELEYDVGTAAAQAGQVGAAVLHLERALRENPWDSDARLNLERIRAKRIDKVMGQEPGESPLQRLAAGLPGRLLFWASALVFWAACGLWLLRGFGRLQLATPWLVLLFVVAGAALGASLGYEAERSVRYAVVVGGGEGGQGVKVHSGPAGDLPSSFEVHDGLKVLVLDSENGFVHIRLGNGLEGYAPESEIQEI